MSAPTRMLGRVDDRQYGTLVTDVYEHIPDLWYPQSVQVFGEMRRDPRLAAIVDGYTLQLRRAQWQLNGAGCRPEVTQFVADCLGLNVVGQDTPSGARRRGVSWSDHLRSALLMLVFGHYGFELSASMAADGRARLDVLAERMPATISAIHADPGSGALLGVDQQLTTRTRAPQIPADRLAWYVRNREGASWQGVSLLRPAYAPWLLKREMMRVAAISNRRWGAGVPVAEALPGTNPTGEQLAAAQQMMSAARAGDMAGVATPPGFTAKIMGLTGGVPDTLGFIRFLNQEMAGSVLMPHLDLGTSESGARALGTAFIDSWSLAIEAEAEGIADTATRQIAARIVEWNWGEDEPVPVVAVSGIGSRREVTAESLQLLLSSGALAADPGLEAWVRREYRLPERVDMPLPAPTARGGRATPNPADAPVSGEVAAAVDPAVLQDDFEQAVVDTTTAWEAESSGLVDALAAATAAELAGGMLVGLAGLSVPPATVAALSALLSARMLALASEAATQAAADAGVTLDGLPDGVRRRVEQHARATTEVIVSGYVSGAARVALTHAGADVDPDQVAELVRQHLTGLSESKQGGLVRQQVASGMSAAQAAGREAAFRALPAGTRFKAVEANDRNRCAPCAKVDGTVYPDLGAALADYPTGRYRHCLGGHRCRGHITPA